MINYFLLFLEFVKANDPSFWSGCAFTFVIFSLFLLILLYFYRNSPEKRKLNGVILEWSSPRELQAGYDMVVTNDTGQDIFNVGFDLDNETRKILDVEGEIPRLEHLQIKTLHIIPKRKQFAQYFQKLSEKSIKIGIKYYISPLRKNPKKLTISFSENNFAKNLKDLMNK